MVIPPLSLVVAGLPSRPSISALELILRRFDCGIMSDTIQKIVSAVVKIAIGIALLAVLLCAWLLISIFTIIGVCKLVGVNPYDGYWMYGILTAPIGVVASVFFLARSKRST